MTTMSKAVQFEKTIEPWIQTFSGKQFYPLAPKAADIELADIAHALSMKCRYGGHCRRFYSVAEHSVHVAGLVPERYKLHALLHDAAEAYSPFGDVPRPIKRQLPIIKAIEDDLDVAIAAHFGIEWPYPEDVHVADARILADEKAQIMGPEPAPWHLPYGPAGVEIRCWTPAQAKWMFLKTFRELTA